MPKLKPEPIRSGELPGRIRDMREKAGLTPQACADKLEISRVTLVQWEDGRTEPGIAMLEHLAVALDTTPQYLAYGVVGCRKAPPVEG